MIGGIMMGAQVLGGIMGGMGQIWGGRAQQAEAEYKANVAESKALQAGIMADFAMQQAGVSLASAGIKSKLIEREGGRIISEQRAAAGKSGVTGLSKLETELDTAVRSSYDAALVRWAGGVEAANKAFEAQQQRHQAQLYRSEAKWSREAGKAAKGMGMLAGISTMLTSTAGAAAGGKSMGMF